MADKYCFCASAGKDVVITKNVIKTGGTVSMGILGKIATSACSNQSCTQAPLLLWWYNILVFQDLSTHFFESFFDYFFVCMISITFISRVSSASWLSFARFFAVSSAFVLLIPSETPMTLPSIAYIAA